MVEPVLVGPTGWPERTLFWEIAEWCWDWLRQPDGPNAGARWEFTDEQARMAAWWYAIDETGRWLFRRGTIRLMKGAGKDPLGAVFAAVDFAGPARWYRGRVIQHPAPWVQIVAVSRDQTRTTMRLFPGLFSKEAVAKYGIDINKGVVYGRGSKAIIEAVYSSPLALEGPRPTLTLRNEVQNWRESNDGHAMANVIDGNLAKSRDGAARALSLCNAHIPGEDSVGEREWDAYQAIEQGRTRTRDVLYFAREAPANTSLTDEQSLRAGLIAARGDSTWLDVDRLMAEIWDPRTDPREARRKYLNQVVAAEDAWIEPHLWDQLGPQPGEPSPVLADGDMIALGFDGSKSDDHSALIATRISDGAWFTLGVWDPEKYGGLAPRIEIDGAVRQAFANYDVVAFFSDLHPFESYVDKWAEDLAEPGRRDRGLCVRATADHWIAWDMRSRGGKEFTLKGAMRTRTEIIEKAFRHDGDHRVRQHAHNARRRPNAWGVSFGKENRESRRKVDSLTAGILSRMARRAYLELPPSRQRKKKTGRAAWV